MGKFKLKDFVDSPSAEKLTGISRIDWLSLAKYYDIEVSEGEKKADIIVKVTDYLVTQDILTKEEGSDVMFDKETTSESSGSDSDEKAGVSKAKEKKSKKKGKEEIRLEVLKLEMEKMKLEAEAKEKQLRLEAELEAKRKQEETEAKEKQLRLEAEAKEKQLQWEAEVRQVQNERLKLEADLESKRRQEETEAKEKQLKWEAEVKEKQLKWEAEVRQVENERLRLELELEAKRQETEEKKLQTLAAGGRPGTGSEDKVFKVDNAVKSVPIFVESEVDSFFLQFEKVATQREWPKEYWSTLVQSSFRGKAREVYAAMSVEGSMDYESVKAEVLKSYEWVPERYREKFRSWRKSAGQTHMEYSREQKLWYDRWIGSRKIDNSYEKLEELILLEQFKVSIHPSIKMFLDERDVETVEDAAKLADNYALTHKIYGSKNKGETRSGFKRNTGERPSQSNVQNVQTAEGGNKSFSRSTGERTGKKFQSFYGTEGKSYNREIICYRCGNPGHIGRFCTSEPISQVLTTEKVGKAEEKEKSKPLLLIKTIPSTSESFPPNQEGKGVIVGKDVDTYDPYKGIGNICFNGLVKRVEWLRDTGSKQTVVKQSVLPNVGENFKEYVLLQGFGPKFEAPLINVRLETPLYSGNCLVAVVQEIPIKGVDLVLANDVCGSKVFPENPIVTVEPSQVVVLPESIEDEVFAACAVTRSKSKQKGSLEDSEDLGLGKMFGEKNSVSLDLGKVQISRGDFIKAQSEDEEIKGLKRVALEDPVDIEKENPCLFVKDEILLRKYSNGENLVQVVVPKKYRNMLVEIAHASDMSGHFGVKKTREKLLNDYFWPGMTASVKAFCKSCEICQKVGKPQHHPRVTPLKPMIAIGQPFEELTLDCVGPLPKTKKGNEYLLTVMCNSTRFPDAFPLRSISAPKIIEVLQKFISYFGIPKKIFTDQGSNFMSKKFQEFLKGLNIDHITSTPYRPQSQGKLERFHGTLKTMIRSYCDNNNWDVYVPYLLFAVRDSVSSATNYTPFQLVFAHNVRNPLKLVKEQLYQSEDVLSVEELKENVRKAWEVAQKHAEQYHEGMKTLYDRKSEDREFKVGDEVLVLLPTPGKPLAEKYVGPCTVTEKVSEKNYKIRFTEGRRNEKVFHIDRLKKYFRNVQNVLSVEVCEQMREVMEERENEVEPRLKNSEYMSNSENLGKLFSHLEEECKKDCVELIQEFSLLFTDLPRVSKGTQHVIRLKETVPIRQRPYRMSQSQQKAMEEEVKFLLENGLAEDSSSEWASPCLMVPKPDGTFRMCTDYRKLNNVTVKDSYPMPRIDDIVDQVANAKYLSKIDLLKGFYQIQLDESSRDYAAFVTPKGLYNYTVMPFGLCNSPITFQRHMNMVLKDVEGVYVYIDDIVVPGNTWQEHLTKLKQVFQKLKEYDITVNLAKCEFGKATVTYLGHEIGSGLVKPLDCHIKNIQNFKRPETKKELMSFLGSVGYYRKFCRNFSDVASPLTDLLKKNKAFEWTEECHNAYENLKLILMSKPVVNAPCLDEPFKLFVDSSEVAAGGVLMQEKNGVLHPLAYFSKKFNVHQKRYSIVEKEALSLILNLSHFEVYLKYSPHVIEVFTDNNPLTFINKCKQSNKRILRWSLLLQEYNIKISHIQGKKNVLADTLTRL